MTPKELAEKIAGQTGDWISLGRDEFMAFTIPAIQQYENDLLETAAQRLEQESFGGGTAPATAAYLVRSLKKE